MKNRKNVVAILAIMFLLFSGTAIAQEQWDKTDKWLLGTAVTSLVVDWSQTRYIARHPDQFYETNRYLGDHPSVGKVNRYFAANIIGTVGVAMVLPSRYRKFWLGGVTVIELSAVRNNLGLGIKTDF